MTVVEINVDIRACNIGYVLRNIVRSLQQFNFMIVSFSERKICFQNYLKLSSFGKIVLLNRTTQVLGFLEETRKTTNF